MSVSSFIDIFWMSNCLEACWLDMVRWDGKNLVITMWFAHVCLKGSSPKLYPISIGFADEYCGYTCLWLIPLATSELGIRLGLVRNSRSRLVHDSPLLGR